MSFVDELPVTNDALNIFIEELEKRIKTIDRESARCGKLLAAARDRLAAQKLAGEKKS